MSDLSASITVSLAPPQLQPVDEEIPVEWLSPALAQAGTLTHWAVFGTLESSPKKPKKQRSLSMLARTLLAQWPAGELRTGRDLVSAILPTGESGCNVLGDSFLHRATIDGYLMIAPRSAKPETPQDYALRYVRTEKTCKLPVMAKKRDGRFPVSQDVHACLVWGHPIWNLLHWAERMNPGSEVARMAGPLRPFMWLGRRFGRLRWALGDFLLGRGALYNSALMGFPSDTRVLCGMLRLGIGTDGSLALLPTDTATKLVLHAMGRDTLLDAIRVE